MIVEQIRQPFLRDWQRREIHRRQWHQLGVVIKNTLALMALFLGGFAVIWLAWRAL